MTPVQVKRGGRGQSRAAMTDFPRTSRLRLGLAATAILALAACSEDGEFSFGSRNADADGPAPIGATRLVERDVEAPEIFEITTEGLWDGRPSLGGVWVAHPDVGDPERVIIRNDESGSFVIGALFRRERDNPGPALQISSDAAAALGVLAGDPTTLNVTALRREEVTETGDAPLGVEAVALAGPAEAGAADALAVAAPAQAPAISAATVAGAITTTPLEAPADTIAAVAAAAIESAAPAASAPLPALTPALTPARAPAPAPADPGDDRRAYVQIGIFSVQENANNTGQALRNVGLEPTIYDQSSNGRQFWRVVVGPATSAEARIAMLEQVRALGFDDAFFVNR